MAPFTRSAVPLTLFNLTADSTRTILFFMLVARSAQDPHWYSFFACVSKRTQRTIDGMLQDPSVLEHLTFWETANNRTECAMFARIAAQGLSRVKTIRLIANPSSHHRKDAFLPYLKSLQHLHISGASQTKLFEYLTILKNRLLHLTTDCIATDCIVEQPAASQVAWQPVASQVAWPKKVTLMLPTHDVEILKVLSMAVTAYMGGMKDFEIGPSSHPACVEIIKNLPNYKFNNSGIAVPG